MSSTTGPRAEGSPKAIGLVPSAGPAPPNGRDVACRARGMDADEPGLRDHLAIIGAAPAHPAVGGADDRHAVRRSLFDRSAGGVIHDQHADIVAAIQHDRDCGLADHADRLARALEAAVLGDVQELCQPRIFVAAEGRVDDVVGDDARLLGVVADAAQRAFAMLARLGDAQMHAARCHIFALSHARPGTPPCRRSGGRAIRGRCAPDRASRFRPAPASASPRQRARRGGRGPARTAPRLPR